jgi:membrane-associated protease RseP (regulator of RpoE activity)
VRVLTLHHDDWRNQLVARLWDGETGAQLSSLDTGDRVYSLSGDLDVEWSPDNTSVLFKGLQNRKLWLLPIPPEAPNLIEKARQVVPRCLTAGERSYFGLSSKPPLWCIQRGKTPYRYRAGIEFNESDIRPGDEEKKVPRQAVVNVVAVTPGLPAETAGMKPDDILVAINGETPTDMSAALVMISQLPSNVSAKFKIKRGEALIEIELMPRF